MIKGPQSKFKWDRVTDLNFDKFRIENRRKERNETINIDYSCILTVSDLTVPENCKYPFFQILYDRPSRLSFEKNESITILNILKERKWTKSYLNLTMKKINFRIYISFQTEENHKYLFIK